MKDSVSVMASLTSHVPRQARDEGNPGARLVGRPMSLPTAAVLTLSVVSRAKRGR
jgi:hypothetical protein